MMYYTYGHIRPDTGVIFYVGKGSKKRAYSRSNRNTHWRNVVNKNNGKFDVKIFNWFNNEDDALASEIWQIAELKQFDILVNETPGGDNPPVFYGENHPKRKKSKEENSEISLKAAETRKANGNDLSGDKNPMRRPEVAAKASATMRAKGDEHPSRKPETRAKMSAGQKALGDNHPSRKHENKIKNSAGVKKAWALKTDEERKDFGRKISDIKNSMSDTQRFEVAAKKSVSIKAALAKRTPEEKQIQFEKVSKPVINLTTGEIFKSAAEANLFYGFGYVDAVASSCRATSKLKSRKIGPNKYQFAFYSEGFGK